MKRFRPSLKVSVYHGTGRTLDEIYNTWFSGRSEAVRLYPGEAWRRPYVAGVPQHVRIEGELRPALPGFRGGKQLVLDAFVSQHGRQQPRIARRPVVHGTAGSDQRGPARGGESVPQAFRFHHRASVEGVRIGVPEDTGGPMGAAVVARRDIAFQDGHLMAAGGKLPGGGGTGKPGAHHHIV